jgi:hypothetical protein
MFITMLKNSAGTEASVSKLSGMRERGRINSQKCRTREKNGPGPVFCRHQNPVVEKKKRKRSENEEEE